MRLEPTSLSHPTRRQLVAFAETLLDRRAPVSALLARHVARCTKCAQEVKHIRASFELTALAPAPEPSDDLAQRIMAQARKARQSTGGASHTAPAASGGLRAAACVAGLVALAWFSFGAALNGPAALPSAVPVVYAADAESVSEPPGVLRHHVDTVEALSTALSRREDTLSSPRDAGHRRTLEALDRDVRAALAALERNPGCPRANQVVHMSLERQLEGLRNLYLDRTL